MTSLFEKLGADILARMFEVAAHGLALIDVEGRFLHLNAVGCGMLNGEREALLGRDFLENIAPEERGAAGTWFAESFASAPRKQDFTVQWPLGERRTVSFFSVPVTLEERRVSLTAFHDVTEVRRAEYETRTLAEVAASLALEVSVRDIANTLAQRIVERTRADAGAVMLHGASAGGRLVGAAGLPEAFAGRAETALLEGATPLSRQLYASAKTSVVHDFRSYCRADPAYAALAALADARAWDTLVFTPLLYRGRKVGGLLTFYGGAVPADEELAFLQTLADQSVFAIENARLSLEMQDQAVLEERSRLARELHDSVSQALYGIALGARSARAQLDKNPERVAERLDYVLKLAEAGMAEMRALIFELRPETLQSEGLVVALNKQAAALHARHHLTVTTDLSDEPTLPVTVKGALYRIAQEALHNVVKHAKARHVRLALRQEDMRAVLEVGDDGTGFDPRADFPGHLGLSSMRERAEMLGGTFRLESEPGAGTRLLVEVPVEAPLHTGETATS